MSRKLTGTLRRERDLGNFGVASKLHTRLSPKITAFIDCVPIVMRLSADESCGVLPARQRGYI